MEAPKELNQEGLEEHFKTFFKTQSTDFRASSIAALVENLLGKDCGKILDLGCGSCVVTARLLRHGYNVTSCDTSEAMIEMATKILSEDKLAVDRLHLLNISECSARFPATFDTIINLDVIEHIKDDKEALEQMYDILAPDGRLILSVPAHPSLYGPKDEQVGHYRRYSKAMLKERLEAAGFKNIRVRYWNFIGYLATWLSLNVFKKGLDESFRNSERTCIQAAINGILRFWLKCVENYLPLPLGLTLIAQAEKTSD